MLNSEKIKILKQNLIKLIKNSENIDENYIFNFAKKQRKEMQIEISKGELKSIVNSILYLNRQTNSQNRYDVEYSNNKINTPEKPFYCFYDFDI